MRRNKQLLWNTQPHGVVDVNRGNPLTIGLTELKCVNSVKKSAVTLNSASQVIGREGAAYKTETGGTVNFAGDGNWRNGFDKLSIVFRQRLHSVGTWEALFTKFNATVGKLSLFKFSTNNYFRLLMTNNVQFTSTNISSLIDGKYHTFILTLEMTSGSSTTALLYVDGTKHTASGAIINGIPTDMFGVTQFGGASVETNMFAVFPGVLFNASQVAEITHSPWRLFSSTTPKPLWVPAAAAGASATSVFDGKIIIKSSGTNLLDGKVQVKDVIAALLDGKVAIGSVQQSLLDGKLQVKDVAISYLDGKVMVKNIATSLLDGNLVITQGGVGSDLLDGKIQIKDALTALVDGKVIVKSVATDLLDGKLSIGTMATNLLDGKLQIKDIATALLDGKIQVKSATVDLVDGKIIIADGVTSFSSNNQLLIDSVGGKVLQLGNTRINTWNTAGRPASPKTGTIGFNTQTVALDIYDGAAWKSVTLS